MRPDAQSAGQSSLTEVLNSVSLAMEVRSNELVLDDERLTDHDGVLREFADTREEQRARRLAQATEDAVLADGYEAVIPFRRTAEALSADGDRRRAQWSTLRHQHDKLTKEQDIVRAVPGVSRPSTHHSISLWVSALIAIAEGLATANILDRSNVPLPLAIAIGLGTGCSMKMIGANGGRDIQLMSDRRRRGIRPDDVPDSLNDLYLPSLLHGATYAEGSLAAGLSDDSDDGVPEDSTAEAVVNRPRDHYLVRFLTWSIIGAAMAGLTPAMLTLIGVGGGEGFTLAVGMALLASITIVGSAAAESYGTNAAADRLQHYQEMLDELQEKIDALSDDDRAQNKACSEANDRLIQAELLARSAGQSAYVVADRLPENIRIGGYEPTKSYESEKKPNHALESTQTDLRLAKLDLLVADQLPNVDVSDGANDHGAADSRNGQASTNARKKTSAGERMAAQASSNGSTK
jgi:hypothetical protein